MEIIPFEQLVQAIGVPAAIALWIWWQSRGGDKPSDAGDDVLRELRLLGDRMTKLEVIVEERTRR